MDVFTAGEALAAFATREPGRLETSREFTKTFGGSEANTAIGLARLGRSVRWVSVVGDDPFGREVVATLRGEGVDVSHIRVDPTRPTGLMVKELRTAHEPHVYYYRRDSAAATLGEDDIAAALAGGVRRIHLTGITLALGEQPRRAIRRLLEEAKGNAIPVSFDPNLRRKLQDPDEAVARWREVFPYVSDLLLSASEAGLCEPAGAPEETLERLAGNGFRSVVITRGAHGAVGLEDGTVHEVPATAPAAVADAVGGGDAFTAGFLHERLAGSDFDRCLATGAWVAGHAVSQRGDWEGLPDTTDYQHWTRTRAAVRR